MFNKFLNLFRRVSSGAHKAPSTIGRPVGGAGNARPLSGVSLESATKVFTPTTPRTGRQGLIGRQVELTRIVDALTDEGAHVVIYAERGRGKTSLSNLVVERLRRTGTLVGRYVCDATSTFDQILIGIMRDLPPSLLSLDPRLHTDNSYAGCESLLPKTGILPADIASIPERVSCNRLVFVVDEFDRVQDPDTRTRLADTIKLLSDRGLKLRFMVVGVSSTLEDIIGQHHSIQRNITAVHLPLLDKEEVESLVIGGGGAAGVVFSEEACAVIVSVAKGMPYMAQLMGLRIIQQTLARRASETSREDLVAAIERLISDASSETTARYATLTSGPRGDAMSAALNNIATTTQDRWGRILPVGVDSDLITRLLDEKVIEPSRALPGSFEQSNRPLINYVLLLEAKSNLEPASATIRQMAMADGLGKGIFNGH